MLSSPSHAIVGTRDPQRSARLLGKFGFEPRGRGTLAAEVTGELYGLSSPSSEIVLGAPDAEYGGICLVQTPEGTLDSGPYDARPTAVDLYTRDIEKSLAIARAEGLHLGKTVDYAVGPLQLKEFEAEDEDGLRLVFIEIENRRPSVLDQDPERLHSEVHSMVFTVPDADASLVFWRDTAGLKVLVDAPITGPVISQLMGLPRPNVPVRFVLLCDEAASPARFEILQFVEDPGKLTPTRPLRSGFDSAAFLVDRLEPAMLQLGASHFSAIITLEQSPRGVKRVVAGQAPDGVRFELWER